MKSNETKEVGKNKQLMTNLALVLIGQSHDYKGCIGYQFLLECNSTESPGWKQLGRQKGNGRMEELAQARMKIEGNNEIQLDRGR